MRVIVLRMPDHEQRRARGEKEAERPLRARVRSDAGSFLGEVDTQNGGDPAAECAGKDVERPVHADRCARHADQRRCRDRAEGGGARGEAERDQAGEGEGGRRVAGGEGAVFVGGADDVEVAKHRRRARHVEQSFQAARPQRGEQRGEQRRPHQVGSPAPEQRAQRERDQRIAEHRDVGPQPVARERAEPVQQEKGFPVEVAEQRDEKTEHNDGRQQPKPHGASRTITMPSLA